LLVRIPTIFPSTIRSKSKLWTRCQELAPVLVFTASTESGSSESSTTFKIFLLRSAFSFKLVLDIFQSPPKGFSKNNSLSGWGHLTTPQENYKLIGFDWERTYEKLLEANKRGTVIGDLSDEEIARTKGVLAAYIKVNSDTVAFSLSRYGKLQISSSDNAKLRKARFKLKSLIVADEWVPIKETEIMLEKGVPDEHMLNIASGLKWFCMYKTLPSGKVEPKAENALIALQHVYTGYTGLFVYFEKMLKAKGREDSLKADVAEKLKNHLETARLRLSNRILEDMAESLLISHGDYNRYRRIESIQAGGRFKLLFKAEPYSLGEFESREKAEEFWRKTFPFVETPEFSEAVIKYENARKEYAEVHGILTGKPSSTSEEERVGKPAFLGMKLEQGLQSLKGFCELCGRLFAKTELEKLNKMLSMFKRETYIF
jgi:hypothetical protein